MKLIEEVLSKENLNKAYLQVFRNKGSAGIDGVSVNELKEHLQVHGDKIMEDILKRKYKPKPVKRVEIPKDNGKVRKLGIPTVVDRVIQQAIAQVLGPIYEEEFSQHSYGFRPKRSCEMAIIKSL
jgi:retron-type reverse transcriptase